MKNIQVISDKNLKSQKIKNSLVKILDKSEIPRFNIIIVIGGDGFMLKTLKKHKNQKNSFMG